MRNLTQKRLKEVLHYDPQTGVFSRRIWYGVPQDPPRPINQNPDKYRMICIDRKHFKAHQLAFLYMLGRWPEGDVDHINRKRGDNRWANLREASRPENNVNSTLPKNNASGFKGVHFDRHTRSSRKWRATAWRNNKPKQLGRFATAEDAARAYDAKITEWFGENAATNAKLGLV